MKNAVLLAMLSIAGWTLAADPVTVTDVTAQTDAANGTVDIAVTITGDTNKIALTECVFAATNSVTQMAVSVSSVTNVGNDVFAEGSCTRHFTWNASNDVGAVKVTLALSVNVAAKKLGGVQLWSDGPYWAECNVGADSAEKAGYYFWWGDTVGYERNSGGSGWVSSKDGKDFSFETGNCPTSNMTLDQLKADGYIDSSFNLVAAHDAARAHLGYPWRLPTAKEMQALVDNCTNEWKTSPAKGRQVTGNGKSIFLPVTGRGNGTSIQSANGSYPYGYYWASTPGSDSNQACYLSNGKSQITQSDLGNRWFGYSVRAVRDATGTDVTTGKAVVTSVTLDFSADPLPELTNPTSDEVKAVLVKAADTNLAVNITNGTDYASFRTWAQEVKTSDGTSQAGSAVVMASPNAWLSYALGQEALIAAAPTNGQMRIVSLAAASRPGRLGFTVGVDDIAVGESATDDNLRKVFAVEGSARLETNAMSATNVVVTSVAHEDGQVKFTAVPKDADAKTFFMKVKMTP